MALSDEAQIFAEWWAEGKLIRMERRKKDPTYPITQKDFAEKYDLAEKTLSQWKKDKRVIKLKSQYHREQAGESLSDVLEALKMRAEEGDPASIKLYLQYLGELIEKHQTVGSDDIDGLIVSIVEIVKRHVKDPITLNKIAKDIGELEL